MKAVKVLRTEYQEGETYTERELQRSERVPLCIQQSSHCMYVMKLPKSWEKKPFKGLEETVPSTHIESGIVSISTRQTRKLMICETLS